MGGEGKCASIRKGSSQKYNRTPVRIFGYIFKLYYRALWEFKLKSLDIEKVVFNQVYDHMVSNAIFPALQSSYRQFHSTETALIKVMNDILLKMNSQHVTMLILLDLSAAFDTVHHRILLERLSDEVGIRGTALNWCRSYLSDRSQRVSVHGVLSRPFNLELRGTPRLMFRAFAIHNICVQAV